MTIQHMKTRDMSWINNCTLASYNIVLANYEFVTFAYIYTVLNYICSYSHVHIIAMLIHAKR